jgi:phospholipid/cholesterol/gamma-HCH transport system permease protein
MALLGRTLASVMRSPPPRSRLVEQFHEIGNRSVVFIAVTLGFLGLILVYQGAYQAQKVLPDLTGVGSIFISAMIRVFGPTIVGLMIATRVGAGIAAEIGSMVVTDQIEAMKVTNTDPVDYLVAPRFIACVVMTQILWVIGCLVAVVFGAAMGMARFQIQLGTFLSLANTGWGDVGVGSLKCLAFGIAIPILSAESGFRAHGGSEGVGWATTRAVVNSSFAIIFLDFVISTLAYVVGW